MNDVKSIDLHPEKLRGTGPESALLACRQFVETALLRGTRRVRIITGVGIHGDGTPRLRSRVEREVLAAFAQRIASQHYDQGGAVICLELIPGSSKPDKKYQKKFEKEQQHKSYIEKEERLLVALERFEAAELYYDEGDFRRCRLKLNQVAREFFPDMGAFEANQDALMQGLRDLKKKIDALG